MGKMVEIAKVATGGRDFKATEVLHPRIRPMDRTNTVVTSITEMTIVRIPVLRHQRPSKNRILFWIICRSW